MESSCHIISVSANTAPDTDGDSGGENSFGLIIVIPESELEESCLSGSFS